MFGFSNQKMEKFDDLGLVRQPCILCQSNGLDESAGFNTPDFRSGNFCAGLKKTETCSGHWINGSIQPNPLDSILPISHNIQSSRYFFTAGLVVAFFNPLDL